MSNELTDFEKRLAALKPLANVDGDQLMYSAGMAAARAGHFNEARRWKWLALAASTVCLAFVGVSLRSSMALHEALDREVTLRQAVAHLESQLDLPSDDADYAPSTEAMDSEIQLAAESLPSHARRIVSPANISEYRLRQTFQSNGDRSPGVPAGPASSRPISIGDFRRVLAMSNEPQASIRRLETLRPQ